MAILNTEEYAYIIPPSAQFNDEDGKPYSAGFVEFYKHGTSERYITYADWSGSFNPFRIPLNSQGRAVAIVPKDVFLDMYVYNFIGNLAYSRLNVNYIGEGGFTTDNLVRGIVPESDNVHTRVARTLEDGTQIYGISVDEDLWIAQAIAPNEWSAYDNPDKGTLRWYNKTLYYHLTNVNTDVPPDQDHENWKKTSISEFLKSFSISYGKFAAVSTGASGFVWTRKSGNLDLQDGILSLESEKIYHFTLSFMVRTDTISENYASGSLTVDSDGANFQPQFILDGSRSEQRVEVSWDGAANTYGTLCVINPTLPSGFSLTGSAILWVHSINNTISSGGNQVIVDDRLSLDSANPVENRVITQKVYDLEEGLDGKQDTIEDLDAIRSGAAAGATAVQDPDYVHTDNNFTDADKSKLDGIEAGAEANVNADWNATSGDAEILNKPENLVQDPNYVHTDNNFTNADKSKLAGIEAGAEVNVQADWSQSDSSADDYIKNKPTIYDPTFVAMYNTTTFADLKAACNAKQQILFSKYSGAAAFAPVVPKSAYYYGGYCYIYILEYSSDAITKVMYRVDNQNVWTTSSKVIHANVDEVLTVIYGSSTDTNKMSQYFQDGKTIFMKIGSSAPFKWLPLYSLVSGVYSFRDIQPTQDGKKLQAIDYQWNGTAWSTVYTDIYESQPGTVVLTIASTATDIKTAIDDGSIPVLKVGSHVFQMIYQRISAGGLGYCYAFARAPVEESSDAAGENFLYVISMGGLGGSPYPDTNGVWQVHNECLARSDWDQIDSDSLEYIKNKPNQSPVAAGTDITLTEVNGTLFINSTAVPAHTSAESTKILSVDANGNLVWVSPQSSSQVQADWNQSDSTAVDYIKNKPSVPVIGTITL